jgi:hypothetical protein
MVLRLAMVLELGMWAAGDDPEPTAIDRSTLMRAIAFVEGYLKPMHARVYGDAAAPVAERHATILARWIIATGAERINTREIRRSAGLPGLRDANSVEAAVAVLDEAGWFIGAGDPAPGGRPRKDFAINPRLWEALP